jgi:hypothetical protein
MSCASVMSSDVLAERKGTYRELTSFLDSIEF